MAAISSAGKLIRPPSKGGTLTNLKNLKWMIRIHSRLDVIEPGEKVL
jgi:hypothetical protein